MIEQHEPHTILEWTNVLLREKSSYFASGTRRVTRVLQGEAINSFFTSGTRHVTHVLQGKAINSFFTSGTRPVTHVLQGKAINSFFTSGTLRVIHAKNLVINHENVIWVQGRIQDFKLGGGGALKKIAPSGGRRENFWGISCKKSRFYAKKSYFSNFRGGGGGGGGARNFGVFHVKNHDFTPKKNHIFPNFRGGGGGRAPGAPPPESVPVGVNDMKDYLILHLSTCKDTAFLILFFSVLFISA